MKRFRKRCAVFAAWAAIALMAACSRQAEPLAQEFVGTWRSSRMVSAPVVLMSTGEWEIRSDTGNVMQHGVWRLERGTIVWTVRAGGHIESDRNPIVAWAERSFRLREADGSVTTFDRLE